MGGSVGRGAGRADSEAGVGGLERSAASGDGDCAPEEVGDAWSWTAWTGVFGTSPDGCFEGKFTLSDVGVGSVVAR